MMTDLPIERRDVKGFDGLPIAVHMVGQGRDLVLIHGYFSNAWTNWIRYGHAAKLVEAGFRLILPDLRGHGESAKPHDAAAYPADALTDDNLGLIEQLGLTDYDLGGYSLGARTTVRMLARGATPRRVILSGMGLRGLTQTLDNGGYYTNVLTNLGTFTVLRIGDFSSSGGSGRRLVPGWLDLGKEMCMGPREACACDPDKQGKTQLQRRAPQKKCLGALRVSGSGLGHSPRHERDHL